MTEPGQKKDFFEKDVVVFLIGPFLNLLLFVFAGSSAFYGSKERSGRKVWLVAGGTRFYLAVVLIFIVLTK